MDYKEFVRSTMLNLEDVVFEQLKKILVGEYISFKIIPETSISKEVLAEKTCDYFEKLEIKTGKPFDKHMESFVNNIDSLVVGLIAKTPQVKKGDESPAIVPRSRKYYEKAVTIKSSRALSFRQLVDYSRIMLCLYTSIIKNDHKEIANLDYSVKCLDPDQIVNAMKKEIEPIALKIGKKSKFDTKELYSSDTCTFIIVLLVLHNIINDQIQGETYHE